MPHSAEPLLAEWLPVLTVNAGQPDGDLFLVGHSLGAITILRYLESLPDGHQVGGVITVAGFPTSIGWEVLENFFTTPLDFAAVRGKARAIVAFSADNDPYVPTAQGELLRDQLGAKLEVVAGAGHFNEAAGYRDFPAVRDELVRLADV